MENLEKYVTSLELSKKLKKLGVPQKSRWYYKTTDVGQWHAGESLSLKNGEVQDQQKPIEPYFFMPAHLTTEDDLSQDDIYSAFTTEEMNLALNESPLSEDMSSQNALAKLLILAIENKIFTPSTCT